MSAELTGNFRQFGFVLNSVDIENIGERSGAQNLSQFMLPARNFRIDDLFQYRDVNEFRQILELGTIFKSPALGFCSRRSIGLREPRATTQPYEL